MNWSIARLKQSRRNAALSYSWARGELASARKRAGSGAGAATAGVITADEAAEIKRLERKVADARALIARRDRQIAEHVGIKPRIITAAQLGLRFQNVFGAIGRVYRRTGHYTGGPVADNATELIQIARGVHAQHARQGWGGGSYNWMIARDGTLLCLSPTARKAAHVAGNNTGNLALNCPGTTGDTPTAAQRATYEWLMANAHTHKMPAAWRSPVDLRKVQRRVHSDMNPTACPGGFTAMYRTA